MSPQELGRKSAALETLEQQKAALLELRQQAITSNRIEATRHSVDRWVDRTASILDRYFGADEGNRVRHSGHGPYIGEFTGRDLQIWIQTNFDIIESLIRDFKNNQIDLIPEVQTMDSQIPPGVRRSEWIVLQYLKLNPTMKQILNFSFIPGPPSGGLTTAQIAAVFSDWKRKGWARTHVNKATGELDRADLLTDLSVIEERIMGDKRGETGDVHLHVGQMVGNLAIHGNATGNVHGSINSASDLSKAIEGLIAELKAKGGAEAAAATSLETALTQNANYAVAHHLEAAVGHSPGVLHKLREFAMGIAGHALTGVVWEGFKLYMKTQGVELP